MKNYRLIDIVLLAITLIVLVCAVVFLVMSIKGHGSWTLTASLGLICLGNFLNIIGQRIKRKRGE